MRFFTKILKFSAYIQKYFVFFVLAIPAVASAAPPAGFSTATVVSSGLNVPTGFAIAPDNRLFIVEQAGSIKIVKNGVLLPQIFDELPAIASGDRGLLGIAFDPNFSSNHFVYFYYAGLDTFNHVVRFDAATDIGENGPVEIYATTQPSNMTHAGGTIAFGPDGKLYLSLGDNGNPSNAQNLNVPFGKILRLNRDGTIPSDNPFVGQENKRPEIWAYGLRNPFRFQFDSVSGKLIAGDVGQDTWEEINIVEKGKNYGWSTVEGNCGGCGSENPVYQYAHAGQGASVTGGAVYRGTQFPASYQGKYFFADYVRGFIKTIDIFAPSPAPTDFDTAAGGVVDMKVAPDGSLYYLTIFPGRLYRVTNTAGNQPPTVVAGSDTAGGLIPLTVAFSSAGTTDPEGDALTYAWDFGDGTTSTVPNPTKVYATMGHYRATLSVSDGPHAVSSLPISIQAGVPPTVSIVSPLAGSEYRGGQVFSYQVTATDSAGQPLDDAHVSTEVTFHHNTHMHPFRRAENGKTGQFTIPDEGETATDVYYEFRATATDDLGLQTVSTRRIDPKIVQVSVTTSPASLSFELDGAIQPTPKTFSTVAGMKRRIGVPDQALGATGYEFDRWSDGGTRQHVISPTSNTNLVATLVPGTSFNAEYFSNSNLAGSPALARSDASVSFDWGGESPAPGVIPADQFSARWTKRATFAAGEYAFHITADDGARLYVDNQIVIDAWINQAPTAYDATKTLTAGEHDVRMEYYDAGGGAVARLSWDALSIIPPPDPDPAPPEDVFAAKYYPNVDLSGNPVLSRTDETVQFDWAFGSPDPSVPADNFSAEWQSTIHLEAGEHEFIVEADDGVRLFIDDALVLDKWIDQPVTRHTVRKTMAAGHHTVKIQYYERGNHAVAKFSYAPIAPVPAPTGPWSASYFSGTMLSGTPLLNRGETAIDFDWAFGSPDPSVPADNFSARFTRTINTAGGSYHLNLTGDDGVRVRIDGESVVDGWRDQPATTYAADITLTPGNHTVVVEYYERGGHAVLAFDLESAEREYAAEYWSLPAFTGAPEIPTRAADATRVDPDIDFEWGTGSPASGITPDFFAARWTKRFYADAGTYDVQVTADDGVRIFVDDALLLDKWIDQAATLYTVPVNLSEGYHAVRIEYYERRYQSVMRFDIAKQPAVRPIHAAYYANDTLAGTPAVTRDEAAIDSQWRMGSPHPSIPVDHFSAEYNWEETLAGGTYAIALTSDDGVRLFIDGALVHEDWTAHPARTANLSRTLTAGFHRYRLQYFENEWDAVLQFSQQKQ